MKKTIVSTLKYLWKYLVFPAVLLFGFMVVCVLVGVRNPQLMIWMLGILIAGILLRGIVSVLKKRYVTGVLRVLLAFLFAWMRRGEPYLVQLQTHTLPLGFQGKFVVLSDLHVGPYKGEAFVQSLVDKINNQENVDAVFIVGDWVYEPEEGTVQTILEPFTQLRYPIYAVLGNHDEETSYKGENIRDEVVTAVRNLGITLLENQKTTLQLSGGDVQLFGLGDERAGRANVTVLSGITQDDNVIVLAHNPDTIMRYGLTGFAAEQGAYDRQFFQKKEYQTGWLSTTPVDMTIAGHTHAAQIRLAGITTRMIPTIYRRPDDGRYDDFNLFISRGVGETILPMRLFNRATIYVLETE